MILLFLFLCQKPIDEIIISSSQLFIHNSQYSNIIAIYQINLSYVYTLWQITILVSKEEMSHCLYLPILFINIIVVRWLQPHRASASLALVYIFMFIAEMLFLNLLIGFYSESIV